MKYRRITLEVDAVQWLGDNFGEIFELTEGNAYTFNRCLFIKMNDGANYNANMYDYIVRFNDGLIRIMTAEMFEKSFEKMEV